MRIRMQLCGGLVAAVCVFGSTGVIAQQSQPEAQAMIQNEVMPQLRAIKYIERILRDFPEQEDRLVLRLTELATTMPEDQLLDAAFMEMYALGEGVAPYYFARATNADLLGFYGLMTDIGHHLGVNDPMRCKRIFTGEPMFDGSPAMDPRARSLQSFSHRLELITSQIIGNANEELVPVDTARAQGTVSEIWGILAPELTAEQVDLIGGQRPVLSSREHTIYCSAMTSFFETSTEIDPDDAGNMYRSFFSAN